jgi:hypothetical protein
MNRIIHRLWTAASCSALALCAITATTAKAAEAEAAAEASLPASAGEESHRQPLLGNGGRLLLTGGVSTIEGAGGGGLTPWALIGGYGTRDEVGVQGFVTGVSTEDFRLKSFGAALNIKNRLELSIARQNFNLRDLGKGLGLGDNYLISQTIIGAKVRLIGDAVLDQNSLLPQIAVGVQHKINDDKTVVGGALGLKRSGTDFYIAATKVFLGQNLLVNTTLRFTKANQYGILGFGGLGGKDQAYKPQFEGSIAYLLTRKLAVGAELRTKSNRLEGALGGDSFREDKAFDVFAAYALGRNISLTGAYVDLGKIALKNQHAAYLSLQIGF